MRVLGLDPAGKKFGVAGIEVLENGKLDLYASYLLQSPSHFKTDQRLRFMAHMIGTFVMLDKPTVLVSENPWGQGYSSQTLKEQIGSIKAELWVDIEWQGVSEARRAVLGDGYGGEKKRPTAEWLLSYPWNLASKNKLEELFAAASPDTDDGYDELDAVLHVLCYLIVNKNIQPVHKPYKEKKRGKSKGKKTPS